MNVTPTKTSNPRCFACFSSNPWRTYKQHSAKWRESHIQESLDVILGAESINHLQHTRLEVCEPCLKKITEYSTFKQILEGNISKLSHHQEQSKRQQKPSEGKKNQKTRTEVPRPSTAKTARTLFSSQEQDENVPLAVELPKTGGPFLHHQMAAKDQTIPDESEALGPLWNLGVQWDTKFKGNDVESRLLENLR